MILLIDNYDSFVHNLARYLRILGCETRVVRNDQIDLKTIKSLEVDAIVLSPGPCTPNEAGICLEIIRELKSQIPILGICLGHQAIVQALGGKIARASWPFHGRASQIWHSESGVFESVPNPLQVGRYHSLIANAEEIPECLKVTAKTQDDIVMAVEHTCLPIVGLQFHPESILTEHGHQLLENFINMSMPKAESESIR